MRKPSFSSAFASDYEKDGILYGALVRCPISEGKISEIRLRAGFGYRLITAADLPARKSVSILDEEIPLLCAGEIAFKGEPCALLLAPSAEEAEKVASEGIEFSLDATDFLKRIKEKHFSKKSIALFMLKEKSEMQIRKSAPDFLEEKRNKIEKAAENLESFFPKKDEHELIFRVLKKNGHFSKKSEDEKSKFLHVLGEWEYDQKKLHQSEVLSAVSEFSDGKIRIFSPSQWLSALAEAVSQSTGLPIEKIDITRTELPREAGNTNEIVYSHLLCALAAAASKKAKKTVKILLSRKEHDAFIEKNAHIRVKTNAFVNENGEIEHSFVDICAFVGNKNPFARESAERLALSALSVYAPKTSRVRVKIYKTHEAPRAVLLNSISAHSFFAFENLFQKIATQTGESPRLLREKNGFPKRGAKVLETVCNKLDDFIKIEDETASKDDVFRAKKFFPEQFSTSEAERKFAAFRIASDSRVALDAVSPEVPRAKGIALSVAAEGSGYKKRDITMSAQIRADGKLVISSLPVSDSVWAIWTKLAFQILGKKSTEVFLSPPTEPSFFPDSISGDFVSKTALLKEIFQKIASGEKASASILKDEQNPFYSCSFGACEVEVEVNPCTFDILLKEVRLSIDCGRIFDRRAVLEEILRQVQAILSTLFEGSSLSCKHIHVSLIDSEEESSGIANILRFLLPAAFSGAVSLALGETVQKLPISRKDVFESLKNKSSQKIKNEQTNEN